MTSDPEQGKADTRHTLPILRLVASLVASLVAPVISKGMRSDERLAVRPLLSAAQRWRRLAAATGVVLLTACGTKEVVVDGNFPPPLLEALPITLGVWYEPEFSGHEFFDEAKGRSESSWIVKTGEAQVQMWDQLLDGMFTRVEPMDGKPAPQQMNPAVDAVLIPRVDELQYAIPAYTNVKVYEIWMRYAFELVTTNGEVIAEWTMTAYGKTPTAFLQSDEAAVNLAAVVALRDAGAHFVTSFQNVPEVAQWLEDLQQEQTTASAP